MKKFLFPMLCVLSLTVSEATAQVYQQRGGVLGGLAGAAAGAAIGENNDEPLAGALIGGAVGLVTGAAMGNSRDRQIAESRAYQQHQIYQQQYQQQQAFARSVSPQDVVSMTHSGVSDSVIINHIHANGVMQELQVPDVISLHQQGVSEPVISAMQRAGGGTRSQVVSSGPVMAAPPVHVYQPTPVVVEHYVAPRYHYRPRPRYYRNHHRRGRTGMHFSF